MSLIDTIKIGIDDHYLAEGDRPSLEKVPWSHQRVINKKSDVDNIHTIDRVSSEVLVSRGHYMCLAPVFISDTEIRLDHFFLGRYDDEDGLKYGNDKNAFEEELKNWKLVFIFRAESVYHSSKEEFVKQHMLDTEYIADATEDLDIQVFQIGVRTSKPTAFAITLGEGKVAVWEQTYGNRHYEGTFDPVAIFTYEELLDLVPNEKSVD